MDVKTKHNSGFTTLFVIVIITAFIIGLMAIVPLIFEIKKQTTLYRHQLILSRNILASHDAYLRNAYGLSCYHEDVVAPLVIKQFKDTTYENMVHQVKPLLTLNHPKALLDELGVVTLLYTAESLSSEWVENFTGVYQLSNFRELFSELQRVDTEMIPEPTVENKGVTLTDSPTVESVDKQEMSDDSIKKLKQYRMLLERCKDSERNMLSNENLGQSYSIKEKAMINQYIMGSLNDRVISKAHELDFFDERMRTQFNQGCEIEYIITGNPSSAKEEVEIRLFFIRFVINYLEGLSSPTTMARIETEAATLIGIPIPIGTIILLSLESASKSDVDMKTLLNGEGVPIPILKDVQLKGNHKELKLYYDDHLRILLGLIGVEKIIERFHHVVAYTYQMDNQCEYTPQNCIVSHELTATYNGKRWSCIQDGYMVFTK